MVRVVLRALPLLVLVSALAGPAAAQERGGLLDGLFGGRDRGQTERNPESDPAELTNRIHQLEGQIRQLTGTIEQLQFRNQQLEQQLRAGGGGGGAVAGGPGQPLPPIAAAPPSARPAPLPPAAAPLPPAGVAPALPPASAGGRRGDAFDPTLHPSAPGAPQTLGSVPPSAEPPPIIMAEPSVGVPGGRNAGAPLDLSTLSPGGAPGQDPNAPLPPPPSRNPNATGARTAAVAPPSETPKSYYDLGYGYVQRKDYALAEDTFQTFLKKYPNDKLAADAQFWLGESLFQRQRYDAAAESFLAASTKYPGYAKAPDALLRLGQSLGALNQKEMACATLAEVSRKYPRASNSVKQGVEREQKRVRC